MDNTLSDDIRKCAGRVAQLGEHDIAKVLRTKADILDRRLEFRAQYKNALCAKES